MAYHKNDSGTMIKDLTEPYLMLVVKNRSEVILEHIEVKIITRLLLNLKDKIGHKYQYSDSNIFIKNMVERWVIMKSSIEAYALFQLTEYFEAGMRVPTHYEQRIPDRTKWLEEIYELAYALAHYDNPITEIMGMFQRRTKKYIRDYYREHLMLEDRSEEY